MDSAATHLQESSSIGPIVTCGRKVCLSTLSSVSIRSPASCRSAFRHLILSH
jgi:hypothetical protein